MVKMFWRGTLSEFFLRYKSLLKKGRRMSNQIHGADLAGGSRWRRNLSRTPELTFCVGGVRLSRPQPGGMGGRRGNFSWLE
jgi:hypothetical protein